MRYAEESLGVGFHVGSPSVISFHQLSGGFARLAPLHHARAFPALPFTLADGVEMVFQVARLEQIMEHLDRIGQFPVLGRYPDSVP